MTLRNKGWKSGGDGRGGELEASLQTHINIT